MQIRTPAVAGMFYANEKKQLLEQIKSCFAHEFGPREQPPTKNKKKIFGIICPHAGYMYSGPIAAQSFYAISNQKYDVAVIVGPNHWGIGANLATMKDYIWQTPIGDVQVDSESAQIISEKNKMIEIDAFSHTRDHSLEVQIPMLQYTNENQVKILPVIINSQDRKTMEKLGKTIAMIGREKSIIIIGSSDFTHYENNTFAHEQDSALLEPIMQFDVESFYSVLERKRISACGYGAIAATMIACKELGATKGEVLKYATSGDIVGDKNSVVGYGSVVFT